VDIDCRATGCSSTQPKLRFPDVWRVGNNTTSPGLCSDQWGLFTACSFVCNLGVYLDSDIYVKTRGLKPCPAAVPVCISMKGSQRQCAFGPMLRSPVMSLVCHGSTAAVHHRLVYQDTYCTSYSPARQYDHMMPLLHKLYWLWLPHRNSSTSLLYSSIAVCTAQLWRSSLGGRRWFTTASAVSFDNATFCRQRLHLSRGCCGGLRTVYLLRARRHCHCLSL